MSDDREWLRLSPGFLLSQLTQWREIVAEVDPPDFVAKQSEYWPALLEEVLRNPSYRECERLYIERSGWTGTLEDLEYEAATWWAPWWLAILFDRKLGDDHPRS